jgi:hypothetical protein
MIAISYYSAFPGSGGWGSAIFGLSSNRNYMFYGLQMRKMNLSVLWNLASITTTRYET